jgi:tetratricopeptide (TPR) repeat protein/ABC-type dipeptide/oligopeptide/nickel transport system ATPase subunit
MERPDSRLIRVFLSSTFVDFQEERSLLVQQVFPSLRRRARSREVEIVDVDLRWGVTAEQTERGETLPLCLGEIDRCRPYFISLLGERYGWVPPPDYYKPELLERQPWLKERMGGASVTELEILHGVLRNPEMAGHAFFYLRDPAYAQAQSEAGWVADSPHERQKLEALKAQIRATGFPLAEGLPTPKAIAERIEADLWQLIESQFPEQEPADALERVGRRHSDYRRSRTGLYLGGGPAIEQLERWITEGEQRILITGESGAGKSALIANWLQAHQQDHPQDLVHAHHLGCTNDSSAVRPLLGRLIDTASKLLMQEQQISEAIQVPQDWWELVFKVGEVFALLSPWCQRQGRRWILVLDGLDRLADEDQQALPWIPTTIPPGIHVVASALDCPARSILQERQYRTHEVGPLGKAEQQQLIERYLSRYTKKLESGLQQRILAHPLAGSPLFLRVLLEELRQCAWFDTLQEQVEFYLSAGSIDGLYAKVLERLENDGHGETVRRVMTPLWASRAGLSEEELLAITGLAPMQWAPIDLALAQAFGRDGMLLVFDHDFLCKAVESRYLPSKEEQKWAHSILAHWFQNCDGWDKRKSEELPWQLQQAGQLEDLKEWLLKPSILATLQSDRGSREVINYWLVVQALVDGELDELIFEAVNDEIELRIKDPTDQIWFVDRIAALLEEAGLYRDLLLRLRTMSLTLEKASEGHDEARMLISLVWLARAHQKMGLNTKAEQLHLRSLEISKRLLGFEHPSTLITVGNLGNMYLDEGDYEQSESYLKRCLEAQVRLLGPEHPSTLTTVGNLGQLYSHMGNYEQAEALYKRDLESSERLLGSEHLSTLAAVRNLGIHYLMKGDYEQSESYLKRCLEAQVRLLGPEHPSTLITVGNLGQLYSHMGNYEQAEALYKRDLEVSERLLGAEHPETLTIVGNLGLLYSNKGDYEQAEDCYKRCLEARERHLGPEHPSTLSTVNNLGNLYLVNRNYQQAEAYLKSCFDAHERLLGPDHPSTLSSVNNLALFFQDKADYEQAEAFYKHCLESSERLLGLEHPNTLTTVNNLAVLYQDRGSYEQAEAFHMRCLEASERLLGAEHPDTLTTVSSLAVLYHDSGNYEQAEAYYNRCLEARERLLGPDHPRTNNTRLGLANLLSDQARYGESIPLRRQELELAEKRNGRDAPGTLTSIHRLAHDLYWTDELEESEQLYREVLAGMSKSVDEVSSEAMAVQHELARCLSKIGRYNEAIDLRSIELKWCLEHFGDDDPETATSLQWLGEDLISAGRLEEARKVLSQCLEIRRSNLGLNHEDTKRIRQSLARLEKLAGEHFGLKLIRRLLGL